MWIFQNTVATYIFQDALLIEELSHLDQKFQALQKSLTKHKEHLFNFLEDAVIPFDNKSSKEGYVHWKLNRMSAEVLKRGEGANAFCLLYSIVDKARKNRQEPFLALIAVAENGGLSSYKNRIILHRKKIKQ